MCRALRVSRSGFYDWARAEPSARAVRRAKLKELEREVRELRLMNDFLKKTAAYFAREQQ